MQAMVSLEERDGLAFKSIVEGVYRIVNQASTTCLDLTGGSKSGGTKIQGYANADTTESFANQLWMIKRVPAPEEVSQTPYYTIRNIGTGTYMDLDDASTKDGTQVASYERNVTEPGNQEFFFLSKSDEEYYWIENRVSYTLLEIDGGRKDNGAKVQGWAKRDPTKDKGYERQFWKLIRATRTGQEILDVVKKSFHIDALYWSTGRPWLVLPQIVYKDILGNYSGNTGRHARSNLYASEEAAHMAKAAVIKWAYEHFAVDEFCVLYGFTTCVLYGINWSLDPDTGFSTLIYYAAGEWKPLKDLGAEPAIMIA
jgi:hypothetical protein